MTSAAVAPAGDRSSRLRAGMRDPTEAIPHGSSYVTDTSTTIPPNRSARFSTLFAHVSAFPP
jgi:hypothetical protein